ncbi:uncharacterized protein VTP21DRAFT_10663 [Calcarisporiella thermophila]|uniref:uncharacterized protein n=1 Tax=Calcarisporiella thermophila TaxID=911321 RepID=UPI003743099A
MWLKRTMAETPRFYDPWARRDAWRKHSLFTNRTMVRNMFPGLGIATVAFAVYCGYEWATTPKGEHH